MAVGGGVAAAEVGVVTSMGSPGDGADVWITGLVMGTMRKDVPPPAGESSWWCMCMIWRWC